MALYDDRIGYLAPWLSHDLNMWMKEHPDVTITDIARKCGMARHPFKANFVSGQSTSVKFLAKYALATERDIPSLFAHVGSIINLQVKGIQPYGEQPEPLYYSEMRQQEQLKPKPDNDATEKKRKKTKKYLQAKPIVEAWQLRNPSGRQIDCARETGLSQSAVNRNWNKELAIKKANKKSGWF